MNVRAVVAAVCISFAAARMLRGDGPDGDLQSNTVGSRDLQSNTMDSITDLVNMMKVDVHKNTSVPQVQNKTVVVSKAKVVVVSNVSKEAKLHNQLSKLASLNAQIRGPAAGIVLPTVSGAPAGITVNKTETNELLKTDNEDRVCDAQLCQAQRRARCDAKCNLERQATRKRKQHMLAYVNGTDLDADASKIQDLRSLRADKPLWDIWNGLYGMQIDYIKGCMGYSAGPVDAGDLEKNQAELTSGEGASEKFLVEHGQERIGICYAVYYIGVMEDSKQMECDDYNGLRQKLCPECCDDTEDDQGCDGGCSPEDAASNGHRDPAM